MGLARSFDSLSVLCGSSEFPFFCLSACHFFRIKETKTAIHVFQIRSNSFRPTAADVVVRQQMGGIPD